LSTIKINEKDIWIEIYFEENIESFFLEGKFWLEADEGIF